MVEREHYYADIERLEAEKRTEEGKKNTITFEEYKKMKEENAESVSESLESVFG